MTMDDQSCVISAHCYSYNRGGINNQKLALYGLYLQSVRKSPHRLVLPHLLRFDQVTFQHTRAPLRQYFDTRFLLDLAAAHHVEVLDVEPRGDEGGWDYFHHGNNHIPFAALANELTADGLTCRFFRSLVPKVCNPHVLRRVADEVFGRRSIGLALQLRIEKDWLFHIDHRLKPIVGASEDTTASFREIFQKIKNTFRNGISSVYVVCDEAALPVSMQEIKATIKNDFDIELFWKSDFLSEQETRQLSLLDLSLFDFEMAITARMFVGTTRSTFSNMVALEKYARTGVPVEHHYIYNISGPELALRHDNGAFSVPSLASASDPWDAAHGFHRAQIFQSVGEFERALEQYAAHADFTGADADERYTSLYRIAQIKAELGYTTSDVLAAYVRATEVLPRRAEAWHGASRHARFNQMYKEAHDFAKQALASTAPEDGHFVERWIYDWALLDEYAVSASWIGLYRQSLDACLDLLERDVVPRDDRGRIAGNAKFCLDRLLQS